MTDQKLPMNLVQLIEQAEKAFLHPVQTTGVLLTDIPKFYEDVGVRKVISWLQSKKRDAENSVFPMNTD